MNDIDKLAEIRADYEQDVKLHKFCSTENCPVCASYTERAWLLQRIEALEQWVKDAQSAYVQCESYLTQHKQRIAALEGELKQILTLAEQGGQGWQVMQQMERIETLAREALKDE